MRPVPKMFLAVSSLSLAIAAGCADQPGPTAPAAPVTTAPSATVAVGSPTSPVEVNVGDTVQIQTKVQNPTFTPRDKSVLKVLTTYDGRLLALAPGKTWVLVWTKPWNASAYRDSTLVIVRDGSATTPAPAPEPAPAPGDTTGSEPTPTEPTGELVTGAYYVSTSGSDANPGTQGQPWRTIGRSLSKLRAGQTLYVRGGTYTENIQNPTIQAGTATARITVAAYPGERPVLVGLLWLTRPSYWTFDGLNVTWASGNPSTSHMVKLTNGIGWTYQNAELWGARSFANLLVYGSATGEPANWTLRGNCIHDTYPSNSGNQDHNIYVNTGTSAGRGVIERNLFFNAPNGQNVKLGYGRTTPQPGDGTANVTVRYNTMYNSLKPLLVSDQSHHITIERNVVGKSAEGYAIRAYRLSGTSNVVRDNVLFGLTRLQYADKGSVTDGGGNRLPLDPKFNGLGCASFKPTAGEALGYGHLAP